jgi:hypothetical protein
MDIAGVSSDSSWTVAQGLATKKNTFVDFSMFHGLLRIFEL